MRNHLLILLCCISIQSVRGQLFSKEQIRNLENFDDQTWTWGYYGGVNTYDFKFNYGNADKIKGFEGLEVRHRMGFNVGLIGDLRVNDYVDLRLEPGMVLCPLAVVEAEETFMRCPRTLGHQRMMILMRPFQGCLMALRV